MIRFEDGVPVSERFGDSYYSRADGLRETRYVFLQGNGIGERPVDHVAELGFGTGLNLAALLHAGFEGRFTSFEAYPMAWPDAARALSQWPELERETEALSDIWNDLIAGNEKSVSGCSVRIVRGDAFSSLASWHETADAWILDGFAPDRNPDMWSPGLMRAVFERTAPGGTFATYTAAGHVRRALGDAGFEVERVPGPPGKRHMTKGRRPC